MDILSIALNQIVGGVEAHFASLAEVADASSLVVGKDVAEAAVVPRLGQSRVKLQSTGVVADGMLIVLAIGVEGGAVIVEVGVLRVEAQSV